MIQKKKLCLTVLGIVLVLVTAAVSSAGDDKGKQGDTSKATNDAKIIEIGSHSSGSGQPEFDTMGARIFYGRYGPISQSAGTSKWYRISYPICYPYGGPQITETLEISPLTARAFVGLDRGWITKCTFDARVTTTDAISDTYIDWHAMGATLG